MNRKLLADTIKGFKEILDGKHDDKTEQDFYMKGTIDQVKTSKKPAPTETKPAKK